MTTNYWRGFKISWDVLVEDSVIKIEVARQKSLKVFDVQGETNASISSHNMTEVVKMTTKATNKIK